MNVRKVDGGFITDYRTVKEADEDLPKDWREKAQLVTHLSGRWLEYEVPDSDEGLNIDGMVPFASNC